MDVHESLEGVEQSINISRILSNFRDEREMVPVVAKEVKSKKRAKKKKVSSDFKELNKRTRQHHSTIRIVIVNVVMLYIAVFIFTFLMGGDPLLWWR